MFSPWKLFIPALVILSWGPLSGCYRESEIRISTPMTESAEFVGNSSCETCHQRYIDEFGSSPHGQFHNENDLVGKSGETGCESCHGPGSLHVASGGNKKGLIVNPGKNPESCLQCHISQHAQFRFPYRHPVIEGRMNCVDCHDPHGQNIFSRLTLPEWSNTNWLPRLVPNMDSYPTFTSGR